MSYLHDLNSYDCGCKIVSEFPDRRGAVLMKWCALHKAAPKLLEALTELTNETERNLNEIGLPHDKAMMMLALIDRARQALTEAGTK